MTVNPYRKQMVESVLDQVPAWIEFGDPFSKLSQAQAATTAYRAVQRAAKDFREIPGGLDFEAYAEHIVIRDIERKVVSGDLRHVTDYYIDAVFGGDER